MSKKKKSKGIVLTDKQELGRRILMEDNKYTDILFDGGSRSGKTLIIIIVIIILCQLFVGLRALVARMKFAHARASVWDQTLIPLIQKMYPQAGIDKSRFIVRTGKSEIWLGGLDSKENTERVLGQEFGIIFLNESVEIPQSIRDLVKTRLAQNVNKLERIIDDYNNLGKLTKLIKNFHNFIVYDCNPRQPTHYLYKEFYVENDESRKTLKFYPQDNIEHLPEGYIKNILEKLPEDKKARFLRGEWAYSPGAVYSNVHEKNIINCEKNIYKFYDDIVVGIDWGLHMCAVIWGIKITSDKIKAYCFHEIIVLGGVTSDLINELDKIVGLKEKGIFLYCDHEPDRILECQSAGYQAKKAYKEVGPGDSSVNEYELYYDYNCKYTFQSMVNLVNQESTLGDGFIYGKHVKENDHEADGSRYALHGWKIDNRVKGQGHYILEKAVI